MSKPLISFDSCTVLHLLDPDSEWYPYVRPIYDDAIAGKHSIVISEVTIAECLRLKVEGGKEVPQGQVAQVVGHFFSRAFIERRGITSRESTLAARLIRDHDIGTCDALITATAVYADAQILYTTDGCTRRRKAGKLLTVKVVETTCGKRMLVEPPDAAKCAAIQAGKAIAQGVARSGSK